MAYVCEDCGSIFDEPDSREFCFEEYNGVGSLFSDRHYGHYDCCPECGSEDIRRTWEGDDTW